MRKLTAPLFVAAALAMIAAAPVFAQGQPSAKFAAVWSDNPLIAQTTASTCDADVDNFEESSATGALLATMKMPSGKEILAGISAESEILLTTGVKGKQGGSGTATATGTVGVRIKAVNVDTDQIYFPVPNGNITLHARTQTLSATLGGVLDSCTDSNGDGVIDGETECTFTDEQIELITGHTSANHFNVVFPNLPSGTYQIRARFTVGSTSGASVSDPDNACAWAGSYVALGDRIVTLQDVRAVKGAIEEVEIP
jgi:hypothetical protein